MNYYFVFYWVRALKNIIVSIIILTPACLMCKQTHRRSPGLFSTLARMLPVGPVSLSHLSLVTRIFCTTKRTRTIIL